MNRAPLTSKQDAQCRICDRAFLRFRTMQKVCGPTCARKSVNADKKAEKEETRARRLAVKTRSEWMKEAQDAFNAFIRARDADKPCICCGNWPDSSDWKPGGTWDAGHFLSRGAHPELKFHEDNCHRQLKSCNAGSSKYAMKGHTVAQGYRAGLIARIGLERVEALEGPHPPMHYSVDDLRIIKHKYRALARELTKEAA